MSVRYRAKVRVVAMHDQRRRGDAWQRVADIGVPDLVDEGTGHAGRGGTVAGHVPPRAECVVTSDGGGDDAEHVEALLDGIWLDSDRRVRIGGADFGAHRIVGSA